MFIVNKQIIGFHFLKRFLYLRERMRIQWLSPQMVTVTAAGSIQSQEPDDSSWSSTWVQVTKDLGPPPLPSHTISRTMDRSEVNGDFNWHCMASWCHRWQLYLLSHSYTVLMGAWSFSRYVASLVLLIWYPLAKELACLLFFLILVHSYSRPQILCHYFWGSHWPSSWVSSILCCAHAFSMLL